MKRHDKNIRRERRMIQENGGKAEERPLIGGELHVLSWANLEMSCKPLHREQMCVIRAFGMSWCSLSASSLELNSLTRSLWVLLASFATFSASYRSLNQLPLSDGRTSLTRRRWTCSKRRSASVFLSFLPDKEGDPRLLPNAEPEGASASSEPMRSLSWLSSTCDLDLDFFFFLIL